jgi:hypothetical protein
MLCRSATNGSCYHLLHDDRVRHTVRLATIATALSHWQTWPSMGDGPCVFRSFQSVILFVLLLFLIGAPAHAEKRVALVIGNAAYHNVTPLLNPRNDANDCSLAQTIEFLSQQSDRRHVRRYATNTATVWLVQGQYERLPALAEELVRQQMMVIFASAPPSVLAVKAVTSTISS